MLFSVFKFHYKIVQGAHGADLNLQSVPVYVRQQSGRQNPLKKRQLQLLCLVIKKTDYYVHKYNTALQKIAKAKGIGHLS